MSIEELIKAEVANENPTNQTHHDICVALSKFAEEHNLPYWLVAIIGVSSSSHKKETFEKGYKSINLERASNVFNYMELLANKFNQKKLRTSVRAAFACARFVKAKGTMGEFMDAINAIEEFPKDINRVKDFNKFLFGKTRKFDQRGRLALINDDEPKQEKKAKKAKTKKLDITNEVVEIGDVKPATTSAE